MEVKENILEKSIELGKKAQKFIPAGCHTYSKGDDQFPDNAPKFILRGKGSNVWDVDGNKFIDWGMGLRSVILGHSYQPVVDAVKQQLHYGSNFTRPSPIEVELAELMLNTVPGMDMVKFGKNGSDTTSAAIRLSRAYTKKDHVVMCKDTGFYSIGDWFIGKTECNSGVPKIVQDLSITFNYNDIDGLRKIFDENDDVSCVIMEPAVISEPKNYFLNKVKKMCHDKGAIFIFDETITGFRWSLNGAQNYFKVKPDLCTFGKAMGNGFSVSALMGKRELMELGGLEHKKERVFLLSLTHAGETHSLAAAIATINEIREKKVVDHIWNIGSKFKDSVNKLSKENGLEENISCIGYPCSPTISTKENNTISFPLRTLFLQETVSRGILIPYISISYSHTEKELANTLDAINDTFNICRKALDEGYDRYLKSKIVKPVFRRYN